MAWVMLHVKLQQDIANEEAAEQKATTTKSQLSYVARQGYEQVVIGHNSEVMCNQTKQE